MKQLVLSLDEEMLIWLRRIITDEDRNEALEFVRKVLEPKIKEAELPTGMKRAFDAGGAPGQIGGK